MKSPTPLFSRINRVVLVIGIVCLVTTFAGVIFVAARNDASTSPPDGVRPNMQASLAESFGKLPFSFEVNKGQIEDPVKFLSHGPGYDLFLTANEAVLTLQKPKSPPGADKSQQAAADAKVREGSVLRLKMIGANAAPQIEGQDELPGKVNYFFGNDPEKWQRNVPTYRKVYYKDVYPGIDVVYYGNQRQLEYDFVVDPGANPKVIKFSVAGAEKIGLDEKGNLLLSLKHGDVSLNKPLIYQLTEDGSRREIKGEYVIKGSEIRFKVQNFDSGKPLVIDPVLSYSTYLGGPGNEQTNGIAVDSQGNAYVTGNTDRSIFPTTAGAFKTTSDFGGVFVTKLDPTGSSLVYSTFLGGNSGSSSNGRAIAVDSSGNAFVTGNTSASDFPIVNGLKTNANLYKTTDAGANWNNRVTGLAGDVNAIAVAPNAPNILYAGVPTGVHRSTDGGSTWTKTTSAGIPTNSFTIALAVDPNNSSVVYAGFQNGGLFKSTDSGESWNAVSTAPVSFVQVNCIVFDPVTPATIYLGAGSGALKSTDSGATWTQLNNFGTLNPPTVRTIAIDPTTPLTVYAGTAGNGGLFKSTNGGSTWALMNNGFLDTSFISLSSVVIDPANPSTLYAGRSFSGGIYKSTNGAASWTPVNNGISAFISVTAMVARTGAIYAGTSGNGIIKTTNGGTNWTNSDGGLGSNQIRTLVGHPTDPAILYAGTSTSFGQDAFVSKLNSSGSGLLFSTLLGGSSNENSNGIALDGDGNIHVVGDTFSTNFPTVNAAQSTFGPQNCGNAFVTKINPSSPSYVFSTFLGGNSCDTANGVAVDPSADVYVTGVTSSTDFPVENAFQPTIGSNFSSDAFVTKLRPNGPLVYSTYLGGSSSDGGNAIAVDASGNTYITGTTSSSNFPTQNAIQPTNSGFSGDAFVTKLNPQGLGLVYSTYLGGSNGDVGRGIAVDSAGQAYVTGYTNSSEFPVTAGAIRTRSPLFKSIDGAANWNNDNYGLTASSVTHIVINPLQPWIIYAGANNGVFKSTNSGRTWTAVNNGLDNRRVVAMVIDPATPSIVYAATDDFFNSNTRGVYKTIDGGANWTLRKTGMVNTGILSLAIDPVSPTILYAGTNGGPVYKTVDGADNWTPTPTPPFSPIAMAVDPFTHTTVYAAEASSSGGVFRSTDSGASWQSVSFNQTGAFLRSLSVSPVTPGLIYTEGSQGTFKSTNGGDTWSLVQSLTNLSGKIVFDPVNASTLYFLTNNLSSFNQGLLKSTDGGQTWVLMNKGLNSIVLTALAIDPLKPSNLYVAASGGSGDDAFVTKFNAAGNGFIYSTFIGGGPTSQFFFGINAQAYGIALDSAGNAYITGLAFSQTFPVTPNSYQPFNRGFNDAFISKLSTSFTISGHVLDGGNPVGGVDVVLSDGTSLIAITTAGDGSYEFSHLPQGGSFTVSATKPHFTITPSSQTFNNLNSDQVLDFTATATGAAFYTVSGQVTENGAGIPGVTITLSGSQPGLRTTDSNGNYSFELAGGGNYTVTPSMIGFSFTPSNHTFNNLSAVQVANFAATRQNFVVTNDNNHGAGSLREAILNANATPGIDTVSFNIPGGGIKNIKLLTALPDVTEQIIIDATTQPGYAGSPLIEVDGAISNGNGLTIKASNSTVKGLAIINFGNGIGLWLNASNNNVVQGNYIGVDATGTVARANNVGISVTTSSNNLIGGTTAAARNVISSNRFTGIEINGNSNLIQGNFIGTNAAGTVALNNNNGINIGSPQFMNNVIGGTAPGAGNLISGNSRAIFASGTGTIIQGNLVGTDVTGTIRLPNSSGISAFGENILVGGQTAAARNIISGNNSEGISIGGTGTVLQGNYIGTDITGTVALNNGTGVLASNSALIGGTVAAARNVIGGNQFSNVQLGFNSNPNSGVTVQGNYIGTDVTGTLALSPNAIGVAISNGQHLVGGTTAGAGNVISGNNRGVIIGGTSSGPGNVVQGNLIGLNALGTGPVPNTAEGISISDSVNNIIGGPQAGAGNKIAFNGSQGVVVFFGSGNSIRGNSIFSNGTLGIDLGGDGVTVNDTNDSDVGANQLQNFPVLTSVQSNGGNTTIQGTLKSSSNTIFQIDFYSSAALDASGNGEGAQFFGTTSVTTDGNGDATINVTIGQSLASGHAITATATDPNGNTSEFSAGDETAARGSAQFSVSTFTLIEDIGLATITVRRVGGSAGTLTVDFATADITAIAGQDYTSTSGTLNFGNGETIKTFQIPITEDANTETAETFKVTLTASTVEALAAPSVMVITILDRTTVPQLFMSNVNVVEGGPGTTTQALFALNLTAATGRTISVTYASLNGSATGGTTCGTPGIDYESVSGTVTFQPGQAAMVIPVKICGDSSAEANETFGISLTKPVNATLFNNLGVGTIINDDVLELLLEQSGPGVSQAAALDAYLFTRDPFHVMRIEDWLEGGSDKNTRVVLFVRNLELNPGEPASAVTIFLSDGSNQFFILAAEDVRAVPNTEFTQVVFRLPDQLSAGTCTFQIRAHTRFTNIGTFRIVP